MWTIFLRFEQWHFVPEEWRAFFLFLGVFPLINALFDVISYAVTLTLMRLSLRRWWPIATALLDLIIACALFLALGVVLTAVITLFDQLSGVTFIDLGVLFAELRETPSKHLWVLLMLFSTILPTGLHICAAFVLAAQTFAVRSLRLGAARLMTAESAYAALFAPPALAALAMLPILALSALFWLLTEHWFSLGSAFPDWYFKTLLGISQHLIGAF